MADFARRSHGEKGWQYLVKPNSTCPLQLFPYAPARAKFSPSGHPLSIPCDCVVVLLCQELIQSVSRSSPIFALFATESTEFFATFKNRWPRDLFGAHHHMKRSEQPSRSEVTGSVTTEGFNDADIVLVRFGPWGSDAQWLKNLLIRMPTVKTKT